MTDKEKKLHASVVFLRRDPGLGAFVRHFGLIVHRRTHAMGVFQSLAESIIYQQLSGKAADTICSRFKALFPKKKFPTPQDVLAVSTAHMRAAGLSSQKAAYLKDLALRCMDGTIDPKNFSRMTDEEIIAHVSAVKGIGVWTAQMFLMFTLARPDVLPTGDLGIRKAFKKLFNLRTLPSPERMERLARPWAGHRTTACFYLWRILDEKV